MLVAALLLRCACCCTCEASAETTCICRTIISRLAVLVFRQEQREGAFRIGHARLRLQAEEVALWDSGSAEGAYLSQLFNSALANQQRIVLWDWLLATVTSSLDYLGSLVTYAAIGIAVWSGVCCCNVAGDTKGAVQFRTIRSYLHKCSRH